VPIPNSKPKPAELSSGPRLVSGASPPPVTVAGTFLPVRSSDFDPRRFIRTPLGIHTLMPEYYEEHKGVDQVTLSMHGFAEAITRAIERVGVLSYTTTKARFNPVVGCTLGCAVPIWSEHGIIANAIEVHAAFKHVHKLAYSEAQHTMIDGFFKNNDPEITMVGKGPRKNAWVPKPIHSEISALANDAGVDVGKFAIVSLMMVLCREECMLPETANKFADAVATFLEVMRERARGQKVLMESYGKAHAAELAEGKVRK
jgi:hypothetical protein